MSLARKREQGVSLLEVVVAVFILAVGVLGVAGLQVTSKRGNYESVQRTTATYLAQDLLERMRANVANLGVYTNAGAGRVIALGEDDALTETDCSSASCDGAGLAMYDLVEFSRALAGVAELQGAAETGGLVAPTVCITGPATRPGFITVAVAWRGMTALSNPGIDACGAESGRYDAEAGTDVLRRVLVVNAYVD